MPPRTRTQTPVSRRPRVAGMRDPRRHRDATDVPEQVVPDEVGDETRDATTADADGRPISEPDDQSTTTQWAEEPAATTTEPAPVRPTPAGTTEPPAETPTTETPTTETPEPAEPTPVDLTKPAGTSESAGTSAPAEAVPVGPATTTASPTTTGGKARPTARRRRAAATASTATTEAPERTKSERTRSTRTGSTRAEQTTVERPARRRRTAARPAEEERRPGRVRALGTKVGAPFRRLGRSRVGLPVTLAVVVLVFGLLAGLATWRGHEAWTRGPVANTAVVDVAATAELAGQTRQAIEQIFSYDFAKLDDSVAAARSMGTGEFPAQYQQVFDQTIRGPASQQQLRQTATVLNIGVRSITGDRANVIALVQFHAERVPTRQSTDAPGLLNLDMQRVDGRWKLARLQPLVAGS